AEEASRAAGAGRDEHPRRPVGGTALEAARETRAAGGPASAAPGGVSLHPPLRGGLDGRRRAVLRRPPDGPRLPADVRLVALPREGNGRPLDAARADLDGGKGASE